MQDELLKLLAGRRGHFQMESGLHSERWFELDSLFARPEQLRPFVAELAKRLAAHHVEAVCGPRTGGAKLAEMISAELDLEYFFTERLVPTDATGLFPVKYLIPALRREAVRGRTVAIVDDAVSAGSAARGTYADLVACGARPVALGALFVFGEAAARFANAHHLALEGIAQLPFGCWTPAECPLCAAGVAVEKVSDTI
ncbi:MAG: orotate phosphoribosyltransferase [Opitutus sp.]|nr:orotate phosphoribosyltransferase [Opitutus sp.]